MKNLLLVHLESLNLFNYRMNPEMFPNLKLIETKCIVFDQYYSTATSTLMVVSDLLYGGMEQYECCKTLGSIPQNYAYKSSLLDDLQNDGYHTGMYSYPDCRSYWQSAKLRHIAGFHQTIGLTEDFRQYMSAYARIIENQPFAFLTVNTTSNLNMNQRTNPNDYSVLTDYWESGYYSIDQYCASIWKSLEDKGLLDNTIVVFYGDHGDDFWSHGEHNGMTHGIEPYAFLIHTPLFIWDGTDRTKPDHNADLIQTTDLRNLITLLLNERPISDIPKRKYVFARNLYANQPIMAESLNKSYSVSDGRYLLIVSSAGIEMYDTIIDSPCLNNLLKIYDYNGTWLRKKVNYGKTYHPHFADFFNIRHQRIVRQKFYELTKVLQDEVLRLYLAGGLNKDNMIKEMSFSKIKTVTNQFSS